MAHTRDYYVSVCQTCHKSTFDRKKGLLCSLTNEYAAFEKECPDYAAEEKAVKRQEAHVRRKIEEVESSSGIFGGKAGIVGGIVLVVIGVLWFVLGIAFIDRIFFYPFFLIVAGIISINNGANKRNVTIKREQYDTLDDEII